MRAPQDNPCGAFPLTGAGMFDRYYTTRLKRDLERWVGMGLIAPENRQAILRDIAARASRHSLAARFALVAGILGAVLLSAGVLLFVGANWEEMPRLLRFTLLLTGMWGAIAAFVWLRRDAHPWLAEAALLIALSIYGGSIMLVSQMYHIHGHYPDGVLMWALGALLAAFVLESQLALVMATILLAVWTGSETFAFGEPRPHWPFLAPWSAAMLLAVLRGWRWGIHLAMLAGLAWLMVTLGPWLRDTILLTGEETALVLLLIPFAMLATAFLLIGSRNIRLAHTGEAALWQGAAAILLALFTIQIAIWEGRIISDIGLISPAVHALVLAPAAMAALARLRHRLAWPDLAAFILLVLWTGIVSPQYWSDGGMTGRWLAAITMLGASAWMISLGQRQPSRVIEWLGMLAFGGEVLFLYFTTLGDMLGTSLFMLVGGVLFMALAWGIYRLARRGGRKTT